MTLRESQDLLHPQHMRAQSLLQGPCVLMTHTLLKSCSAQGSVGSRNGGQTPIAGDATDHLFHLPVFRVRSGTSLLFPSYFPFFFSFLSLGTES